MAKSIVIQSSEIVGNNLMIYYREPGATVDHCHQIPLEAFEWRAAEYGYSPSDTETLLRVFLAERWEEEFDTQEVYSKTPTTPQARADARSAAKSNKDARIAAVGLNVAPGPQWNELLNKIPPVAPEKVLEKSMAINKYRETGSFK